MARYPVTVEELDTFLEGVSLLFTQQQKGHWYKKFHVKLNKSEELTIRRCIYLVEECGKFSIFTNKDKAIKHYNSLSHVPV